jgi:hypothetical protein
MKIFKFYSIKSAAFELSSTMLPTSLKNMKPFQILQNKVGCTCFEFSQSTMLPSSLKKMKPYVKKKASKLSLYISCINKMQLSAKQTKYLSHCLRKSMKGAVSVKEAVVLVSSEIQRLLLLNRFRTLKNFHTCKLMVDDFWIIGDFPSKILDRKDDPAFKKRLVIEHFDAVARSEDESMIRHYVNEFIPTYLDILANDSSE